MKTATICIASSIALLVACASGSGGSGGGDYLSNVFLQGSSSDKLVGRVGDHMSSRIIYRIGWHTSDRDGNMTMTRSAIQDPEYILFGESLPRGVTFDPDTGRLSGTPLQAGIWRVTPAVRDRVNGETPYRGRGFWWTTYRTYQGKTWIEAKDPTVIEIQR